MEKVRYYIGGKGIEFVCENTGKNIFADAIIIFDNRNSKRKIQIDWPSFAESQGVEKFREKIKKLIFSAAGQPCDHLELVFSKRGSDYVPIKEGWRIFVEEMLQMSEQNAFKEAVVMIADEKDFRICLKEVEPLLVSLSSKTFKNPYPAVDAIIKKDKGVVLVYRKNPPPGWAIPGGFINYGESAENAAAREALEETGLHIRNLELFGVFSDPGRDPRFHTISIVYTAEGRGTLKAGDDASRVGIFSQEELPDNMAFDHRKILQQFFKRQKKDMKL